MLKLYKYIYLKEDVNEYYWSMHNLVSAEGIELKEDFCKRFNDLKIKYGLSVENPNESDCMRALVSFESDISSTDFIPGALIDDVDPTDSQEIINSKLKKRILYNALYYHTIGFTRNSHYPGTYGAVYIHGIAAKLELINNKDYKPLQFCQEKHKKDYDEVEEEEELMTEMMRTARQNRFDEPSY